VRPYVEPDADNARWVGFPFRPDDVVISAPSKSGTTWTQLLVALLVFDGPEFPEPVGRMSLWMDQTTRPVDEAWATFARQGHRRFIKTHTPLDGLPRPDGVRFVCVGRDPRDAAVSMVHHGDNIDRERLAELIGLPHEPRVVKTPEERIDDFLDGTEIPGWNLHHLAHHYRTFWDARHDPGVALFHFADYLADLSGQLMRLAVHLDIPLMPQRAEELAAEARIDRVRERAAEVAPEAHMGLFLDVGAFFRRGERGEGAVVFTPGQQRRYDELVASLVPPDLARWMHHGGPVG
jgi:aryl sulfotransferase